MATRKRKAAPEIVTVRGRVSTVYLARGQKATVTVTEHVRSLINAGYLEKVDQ